MQFSNILMVEDSIGRREILLDSATYSVGRDGVCDIRLASQFVSRHHATLVRLPIGDEEYGYRIVDGSLNGKFSANGMLINGRKLHNYSLNNEDEIVFGPQARAIYYRLKLDTTDTIPPDEFFDPDAPNNSGSPRTPAPAPSTCGAEAIPDHGRSTIP